VKQGNFICIIGIDGSGKTTQAKKLQENLSNLGFDCRYVYGRIIPIFPRPFMFLGRKIFLRNSNIYTDFDQYSVKKKRVFSNTLLSALYQNFLLADYLIQVIIKIQLPLILGKTLVSDRYVYDTIITDLSIDLDYSDEKIKSMISNLLKLIPVPDVSFLIDVPEEVAFNRKNDVPDIAYLKERRSNYLKVGKWFNMIVIDGSKNIIEVESSILCEALNHIKEELE
jgi:dTMP kinase